MEVRQQQDIQKLQADVRIIQQPIQRHAIKTGGSTHNHGSKTGTGEADAPSTDCDNYTAIYYCSGHSVEACFGHKDIEVSVTTIFMEQMFESNELPTSSTGAHYNSYWTRLSKFKSNPEAWNGGWTENYIAWANDSTDSGSSYNQANLQSGDLIFYSYENNDRYLDISHVAIYIGNGMVVEARGTVYGVVYREVPNISKIVLICRVRY